MDLQVNLEGKTALIMGVANERSIAWAIAQRFHQAGAQIILTYPNEAIQSRVEPLAALLKGTTTLPFDAQNDDDYQNLSAQLSSSIDVLVHSMAFAPRQDLNLPFHQVSRSGFTQAMEISAYSLIGLCGALSERFNPQASVMAMTYYGSQKIIPGYDLMGVAKAALETSVRYLAYNLGAEKQIRVNAISAGPIRTLAASGISGFKEKLKYAQQRSLLKANVDQDDVASSALYLATDLSKHVTGQILYVDSGLSAMG